MAPTSSTSSGGFVGRLLWVDLTTGSIRTTPLDPALARRTLGGLGLGATLYLDLIRDRPDFDALSPHNPLVIMTGPLTGVRLNAVARWTMGAKSPLTGYWGEANAGGFFGAELKFAGYDGIVLTGAAAAPVYLHIDDDRVELRDATRYWGQDVYTVTDALSADLRAESSRRGELLAIGPAGESGVLIANVTNRKGHTAGRCGLGAVWGAKQLKAIFVRGSGAVPVARPEALKALKSELDAVYADAITIETLREFGTPAHLDVGVLTGDIPFKNWQQSDWELLDEIGPTAYAERMLTGHKTCYACGVACKREAEVADGPFRFEKGPGPEYETIGVFGTLCLNPSIESIGKANELCNRYGMDTISCGATVAFAIDCYERGMLTDADTGELALTWGNSAAIVALVEQIGRREGLGALLSQGSARAAAAIGPGAAALLTTVKGLEAPMHDPRSAHGFGLSYAVSPRGACHNASLQFPLEGGGMYLPEFADLLDSFDELSSEHKAEMNVLSQDFGMFFGSCAGFCMLGAMPLSATQAIELVNAVTGFDYTLDEVCRLGRRVWYLKRGLSNLFGARAEHDRLPARLLEPLEDGPTAGSVPDMDLMLAEFYALRGLDPDGVPGRAVLLELDLPELADLLRPAGS